MKNYWTTKPKQSYSWVANKLLKLRDVAYPLIKMCVQNGQTGRFWTDNWSPYGCLETYLDAANSRLGIPINATISSLYRNGSWWLPPARSDQQLNILSYLTTIELNSEDDYYQWEINGKTSLQLKTGEVYTYLCGTIDKVRWAPITWPPRGIPRHGFHCWLVTRDRLPTRDWLLHWGLQVLPHCLLCNLPTESRNHLYWECNFTFDFRTQVAARCNHLQPLRNWDFALQQLLSLPPPRSSRLLTLFAWQATLYLIWTERNSRLDAMTFCSVDTLFRIVDRQIRNKIQSFRQDNPTLTS